MRSLADGKAMSVVIQFNGPVWRIMPEGLAGAPARPVTSPEGRFHHSGQTAVYTSLSADGARVAVQRYLGDGIARVLVPMWLDAPQTVDERGNTRASIVWQDMRQAGDPAPTWNISDAARRIGAQAMLYNSRSRPELSHVVVFQTECLTPAGPAEAFRPESGGLSPKS